jgi:predicted AlkP superfamily phosphohydrolase/phosphomutase
MTRLLLIGVSEATPDLALPWIDQGRLPALRALRDEGTFAPTVYGIPYLVTPQLWATITTGRTAANHGIFDYWQRSSSGSFRATNGGDLHAPQIWDILSNYGARSCVMNVPLTYPPRAIEGIVIAGQDSPGGHKSIAQPPEIYEDLVRRFGRYRLKEIFPGGRSKDDYLQLLESVVRWQTNVFSYLLTDNDFDLFVCYFSAIAMAQHYFWEDMAEGKSDPFASLVARTYEWIDEAIATLRAAAGTEATTIVISECGAGPLRSGVQVNTLLERAGLLHYTKRYTTGGVSGSGMRKRVEQARRVGQRILPEGLYYYVERLPLRRWIQSYLAGSDIDWPRTAVFYRGKGEGNLYVNLAGRDEHGSVPLDRYEAARDATIEALQGIIDPETALPAIVAVHRREELFAGPHLEAAPDLVIEWSQMEYMPTEQDRDKDAVFVPRWREYMEWPTTGSHRMHGLFFAAGPAVQPRARLDELRLLDLAPTVLTLLGHEVPAELEGAVADALFAV